MPELLTTNRLDRVRYRPSREASDVLEHIRANIIPGDRARVGRLAIARSLYEPDAVIPLEREVERGGSPIEGVHLFGDDLPLWASLIATASSDPIGSADQFRDQVEAHWHRGALLLRHDLESVDEREVDFAVLLGSLAGAKSDDARENVNSDGYSGGLAVRLGEVGIDQRSNTAVQVELNAPGVSPHISLMGKTRSGKTRTGIAIAEQIVSHGGIPFLFIDPKGEFVRDGRFVPKSEWGGRTFGDRFPGAEPLDVPATPIPLDFLSTQPGATSPVLAQMAMAFRDSFQKCISTRGAIQLDTLRQVVHELLVMRSGSTGLGTIIQDPSLKATFGRTGPGISLDDIREAVQVQNQEAGKSRDTIEAKLNELTSLKLFNPRLTAADFFSRRWVIGLSGAPDEAKRLVMFLVLDALANHLLNLDDSQLDALGNRTIRSLLVVDEAKEILEYKHGALSNLIRKSAAKGAIVLLMSQSPEDFDQESDDFLAQMGTIIVFSSIARSLRNLRAALGKRLSPEEFSDRALSRGVALAKTPNADLFKLIAWQ